MVDDVALQQREDDDAEHLGIAIGAGREHGAVDGGHDAASTLRRYRPGSEKRSDNASIPGGCAG
jgi:hypothetical protein